MTTITLKPGRDKTARQYHPWIFSGAIADISGKTDAGSIVEVLDSRQNFIAYGYYNLKSQIRVRLLEWDEKQAIDDSWWDEKIIQAVDRRKMLENDKSTNAYRLIYGESDLLPGLIVDRYDNFLVIQILTAGIEKIKPIVISTLTKIFRPSGIYERSDTESRSLEGLSQSSRVLSGQEPPSQIEVLENGYKFEVDIKNGQKTGLYLDQRDNHQAVASFANKLDILDCFSYSGGFSVYALGNGAKTATLIDSSAQSLSLAQRNIAINNLDGNRTEYIEGDVFNILREFRDDGRKFDMIVLDPPKFAPRKSDLKKALAAYKDINMIALKILNPDGILATFSCSGAVDAQSLQVALFWAATDAHREIQIIKSLSQGLDHPRRISFPESEYLKGFICRAI